MNDEPAHLEQLLARTADGEAPLAEFVDAFLAGPVLVPSSSNPTEGILPIIVGTKGESYDSAVVFTSAPRIQEFTHHVRFVSGLTGSQLVRGLAVGLGVVVNPGSNIGVQLDPDAVAEMRTRTERPS